MEFTVDNVQKDIKNRNTKQKAIILNCIKENVKEHITVDDVYELLKKNNHHVGQATIYRYLNQLESEGIVKKYSFMCKKGACFRYLGAKSKCKEHYHLMCDVCGEVKHIEDSSLQQLLDGLQKKHKFMINDTKTMFYGICKRCANAT